MKNFQNYEFRVLFLFFFKKGYNVKKTHSELAEVFGDVTPSISTIHKWFANFISGNFNLQDEHRSGRPKDIPTEKNIKLLNEAIINNPRIGKRRLEQLTGIPMTTLKNFINNYFGLKKVSLRWVPHFLTEQQKRNRIYFCQYFLNTYRNITNKSTYNIVTCDETWLYYMDPSTGSQSQEWLNENCPKKLKPKKEVHEKKIMVVVFFYRGGILLTVPLPEREMLNGNWYTEHCLKPLANEWKKLHKKTDLKNMVLHQDNATPHFAPDAHEFYLENKVKLLQHPPYSPDLSPCDFWLFSKTKFFLKDRKFRTREEILGAFLQELKKLKSSDFSDCFNSWFKRCEKCLQNNGNYF
jgi:[histone H3]-lysine36 N-dimethyltransferase SETMAR